MGLTLIELEQQPWRIDDAEPLTRLLFVQRGVISAQQAAPYLSPAALRHRVDAGRWRRVHRVIYVAHLGPLGEQQRLWVAVLAAGDAVVGGRRALALQGMKGFDAARIELLVPGGRRARSLPRGVVARRTRALPECDVRRTIRPACTVPSRSVVDAAAWARSDDEARTVIAMSFQQRLVTAGAIEGVIARMPTVKRRQLIAAEVRNAAGGSHSLHELRLLTLIREAGLPEPSRQRVRIEEGGRRRYLDLYFDDYGVHVEVDGAQHDDPRARWQDLLRQNELFIVADGLMRFPNWAIRDHPDIVIDQLRRALLRRGWRP